MQLTLPTNLNTHDPLLKYTLFVRVVLYICSPVHFVVMPRDVGPISAVFRRKNQSQLDPSTFKSERISNQSQGKQKVKTTKFLLLVVPPPLDSPSAAAMVRHRKTLPKPFKFRNYTRLPSPKWTPSPTRIRQLEMCAKLGTPPPVYDSPCPAPQPHRNPTESFHRPKHIPTGKFSRPQSEASSHTRPRYPCKGNSDRPRHQGRRRLLFSSTPLPGKPRSLFFSKDARRRLDAELKRL